ncbi:MULTISPECIES: hypothetical protein [Parabacteroides]|uniref:hypothetical protein n=1 Tax=Parabacteroides leei TaxID=2939491 RepID=UPI0018988343|nr:hypothetical protein [Parabacteroides goldsteinii]
MKNKFWVNMKDAKKVIPIEFRSEEVKAEIPVDFDIVIKKTLSYTPKKKEKGIK